MTDAQAQNGLRLVDLHDQAEEIGAIAGRHGVRNVRVFGSVARGDADASSDVDLLVTVQPGHGLISLSAFAGEVEELLGVPVQVTTVDGLKPRIRDRVLSEAVQL